MHPTNISTHCIAQTRVNWPEVFDWLKSIGIKDVPSVIQQLASPSIAEFTLDDLGYTPDTDLPATDASALVALCGKRCYMSFDVESGLNPNVSKIRTNLAEYITNVLQSGHGSVLEHVTWTFAIENVSRVFTGEMNRHRAGTAISEGSMRYIRFDDIGFWTPSSIQDDTNDLEILLANDMSPAEVAEAKAATRDIFGEAFETMEKWNGDLTKIWKIDTLKNFSVKKALTSMFRRLIGMGVSTGGVWTLNARALRHILEMRASVHAEEEIFYVFDQLAEKMVADEPLLFGDFYREGKAWKAKHHKV